MLDQFTALRRCRRRHRPCVHLLFPSLRLRRYALRGLLARLEESGQATNRFSLDGPSTPWGGDGGGVGRMPPPAGNALETASLLTLQRSPPSGDAGGGRGGGAGRGGLGVEDGAWELQRKLLMTEYGEGERGVVGLLEKLIAVRQRTRLEGVRCERCYMRCQGDDNTKRVSRRAEGGTALPPVVAQGGGWVLYS